jgi:hypothetical protein
LVGLGWYYWGARVCLDSRALLIDCRYIDRLWYIAVGVRAVDLLIFYPANTHYVTTITDNNNRLQRSADDFHAMYEQIRCRAPPMEGNDDPSQGEGANGSGWTDVTPPSSPLTTSTRSTFDGLQDEPLDEPLDISEYDQISDREKLEEDRLISIRDPKTIRRLAMAADFSEGRLETVVGSPQKENAGTPTQYVSYQITTKVGICLAPALYRWPLITISTHSPTSSPSRKITSPSAAASQTLYSYGNNSRESIRNAPSRRCPTSTRWSMCVETASALTSPRGGHTRCIASSSG